MVSLTLNRLVSLVGLMSLSAATITLSSTPVLAQSTNDGSSAQTQDDLRPLSQGNLLSVEGEQRLMTEASNAFAEGNYDLAVTKLQQARQLFNQLSNFYQQLSASFSGIQNQIADEQRQRAVATAQMRDQATYQLALVHRAQNKPELAVPLLIQIIRSQQPTRDLGRQAYQQLYELGFVNTPMTMGDGTRPSQSDRPSSQGTILSVQGGQSLMTEASTAISNNDYDLAVTKLQQARQLFNQLSNFYQDLTTSFSGIDSQITDEQRQMAVSTAQIRDQATYQLALVYRAQNKPELAVPLLVQIITSQQPTRELGQQAYRQLFELGFVNSPYQGIRAPQPTSAVPANGAPF